MSFFGKAHAAGVIVYTELVADFMIENDILSVTLGGLSTVTVRR